MAGKQDILTEQKKAYQIMKTVTKPSKLIMVACVNEDGTVQSLNKPEAWPSVEDWQKERIKKRLAGTLVYNFPTPGKE